MASSGIVWIDVTFDWCVRLLYDFAAMIGITYEEINVWLFVIIGPCLLITSICLNVFLLFRQARHPRHSLNDHSAKQALVSINETILLHSGNSGQYPLLSVLGI